MWGPDTRRQKQDSIQIIDFDRAQFHPAVSDIRTGNKNKNKTDHDPSSEREVERWEAAMREEREIVTSHLLVPSWLWEDWTCRMEDGTREGGAYCKAA